MAGRSLGLVVEGNLNLITGRAGAGSVTSAARLLAARHHVSRVSGAPSGASPSGAVVLGIKTSRLGRSGVATSARFLAVGEHVSGVVLTFTLSSPSRAVGVVVDAGTSYRLDGYSCESC